MFLAHLDEPWVVPLDIWPVEHPLTLLLLVVVVELPRIAGAVAPQVTQVPWKGTWLALNLPCSLAAFGVPVTTSILSLALVAILLVCSAASASAILPDLPLGFFDSGAQMGVQPLRHELSSHRGSVVLSVLINLKEPVDVVGVEGVREHLLSLRVTGLGTGDAR